MKLFCNKQCNDVTKKQDGVSSKMLQAQILKTSGTHRISYSNSTSDNINAIIISGDYAKNKTLLLCYKYNTYFKLLEPLSIKHPELIIMLNNIINHLTLNEYNSVYGIIIPTPIIEPPEIIMKIYFVVTRAMTDTSRYFVFKNYSSEDTFIPTYSYKFNVEHSSNTGTELSFSIDKSDNEYKYIKRHGIPGDENGAYILLTLPQSISYNKLYIYNKNANLIDLSYNLNTYTYQLWGFTLTYINIQLDSVADKQRSIMCKNIQPSQIMSVIPIRNTINIITSNIIRYLAQSSILSAISYDGIHLFIYDIYDRTPVLYYTNYLFALNISTYYLFVPPIYKLAFLNANQTDNFMYSGNNATIRNIVGTGDTDGSYNFYSGTIQITINGSFQPISMYTLDYGYLDGKNKIIFSDVGPTTWINPLKLINM